MPDPTAKYVILRDPKTNEILIPKTSALDYEVVDSQPVPPYELNVDADTLQGHPASDFQLAGEGPDMSKYYTKQETYNKQEVYTKAEVDAKLPGGTKPSSHTPGDVIWWDNKSWLVCHYDDTNNQVYLISRDIIFTTKFGSNTTYSGSTIAVLAANYQVGAMSEAALAQCVDVTVNDVTAKVFVPSIEQLNGGFSWFNSDANRIAYLSGTAARYWSSSRLDISYVEGVESSGVINNTIGPNSVHGFRPCVCVQL